MDRLVVRDLGQDGIERSGAGVVDRLDTKEGLASFIELTDSFVTSTDSFVTLTLEVLGDPTGGLVDLLHKPTKRGIHAFAESVRRSVQRSSVSVRRRHRLRRQCRCSR